MKRIVAFCLLSLGVTGASAEELTLSAIVDYEAPSVGKAMVGDVEITTLDLAGKILGETPGAKKLEGMDHVCNGLVVQKTADAPAASTGYCVQTDADGDLWWLAWWGKPYETEWMATEGTGKFRGISGRGTTTLISQGPDGSAKVRVEGTLTLP